MKDMAEIRRACGSSQTQLAGMVGANQSTISKRERGGTGATLGPVERVARALGVEPADLLERSEPRRRIIEGSPVCTGSGSRRR